MCREVKNINFNRVSKGILKNIQLNNYIIKASSLNQVDQILVSSNNMFTKIIAVDFSSVKMTVIPERIAIVFKSIQILNLQNNLICEVPQYLQQLQLVQLNLNNNLLKQIAIDQVWIRTIERLDLGKNHIRFLPESLYEMNRLNILDVRSNDFTCLHSSVLFLKNKLQAFGIDWVKYDFHLYYYKRQDILVNKQLDLFWEIILEILAVKQTEYIQCYDFIQSYNACQPINSKLLQDYQEDDEGQILQVKTIQMHSQQQQQISQPQDMDQSCQTFEFPQKMSMQMYFHVLHFAVINEDLGILRTFIENDISLTSQVNDDNHTPLSLAIQEEKYHCAKILLMTGANINLGGGIFGSCLNIAIIKVQYFLIRDLINCKHSIVDINKQDRFGNGPLHHLVSIFHKNKIEASKIGQLLLDAGAEPNQYNDSGYTPLQLAIKKGVQNAIDFFLTYNSQQKSQCFSLKLFTTELDTLMHLAAFSENLNIILLIYRLYPFQLFLYSNRDQRPIDIIQKNYTLSKIFQAIEIAFIHKNLLFRKETVLVNHQKSKTIHEILDVGVQKKQFSSSLNESEEENGESINKGMALMNFQTKLKKNHYQIQGFLLRSDSNSIKLKDTNKVPSEKANVSNVTRSIQQDRNDIHKLELHNKQLKHQLKFSEKNQKPNNNKQIHQNLQQIRLIYKNIQNLKDEMITIDKLTSVMLFERCLIELEIMKNDPIMKYFIDNAQDLQNFGKDEKITELINFEKLKLQQCELNIFHQEQVINFGYNNFFHAQLNKDTIFIQYECLQKQKNF